VNAVVRADLGFNTTYIGGKNKYNIISSSKLSAKDLIQPKEAPKRKQKDTKWCWRICLFVSKL